MAEVNNQREFDLVVWGATGFTGALVAEYLTKNYLSKNLFKFAIAGRSESKLNKLKQELIQLDAAAADLPVLVGDSHDEKSMDDIVKRTRVIITTVGPFMLYGTSLVESCVRNGTDYCDITGETPWVRSLIDRFDEEAKRKGVMIVPMCGFDSIPADLGSLFVVDHIKQELKEQPTEVHSYVSLKGGASGGTIASLFNMIEGKKLTELRNVYLLNPSKKQDTPTRAHDNDQMSVSYSKDIGAWSAPFVMAAANTRVVRRSAELLNYGDSFSYNETQKCKSLPVAVGLTGGLAVFGLLASMACSRRCLKRFLPTPGEGPSREVMRTGFFQYYVVGHTSGNKAVHATVSGGEPGYSETAKMLSEAALTMVLERDTLPGKRGGLLTPASAMGQSLIKRLHQVGILFQIKKTE